VPDFDSGRLDARGRRVVVVGGGDTAMDCVRTAVRQGAASVTCLYRRDRENMPGSAREVLNAEEEGVRFEWLAAPLAFEGDGGRVSQVRARRMRLGSPDVSGRRAPVAEGGEDFALPAELVILALGFDAEDLPAAFRAPDLAVTRWGTIRTGPGAATSLPGVFAGGDIVRGASLVVWAMREARDAAAEIHQYLKAAAARGQKEAA
jgi:glutamate synthase (NADPH/NADH) small chain